MQTIQKADGFEAQKFLVLPEKLLKDISCHPLIKPFYITDIGFFPSARFHYRERPEGCDATIFIYCTDGQVWVRFEQGGEIDLAANTLLVIPAHTPHIYAAAESNPWSIYWFHVRGEEVDLFLQAFTLSHSTLRIPTTLASEFLALFNTCYETLLYKGYSWRYHVFVSQVMRHLLGRLVILQNETPHEEKKNEYIEQAIHYMLRHLQGSMTLDELADHVHVSKPYLIHIFKEVTGSTPMEYAMRLKIRQACFFLELTDQSVKEVSRNVGIQDPYYFSRVFHKVMGQSPSAYREAQK